jgi:hypothetical protein
MTAPRRGSPRILANGRIIASARSSRPKYDVERGRDALIALLPQGALL